MTVDPLKSVSKLCKTRAIDHKIRRKFMPKPRNTFAWPSARWFCSSLRVVSEYWSLRKAMNQRAESLLRMRRWWVYSQVIRNQKPPFKRETAFNGTLFESCKNVRKKAQIQMVLNYLKLQRILISPQIRHPIHWPGLFSTWFSLLFLLRGTCITSLHSQTNRRKW